MGYDGFEVVRTTTEYRAWLFSIRDVTTRSLIMRRVNRLIEGHAGDTRALGSGVHELRIHSGAGYRVYYIRYRLSEKKVLHLLNGGNKSSQRRDIEVARKLAERVEEDRK